MARGGRRAGAGRKKNPYREPQAKPVQRTPRTYDPEVAIEARKLCRLGATVADLADFFGVHGATINRWAIEFSDFCEALKAGREASDDRVERSLYHRAVGYTFDAVKVFQFQGKPVIVPYQEHVPPDVGAATLWLKNRRPDVWRDKQVHELTGKDGGPIQSASVIVDDPVEAANIYQRMMGG